MANRVTKNIILAGSGVDSVSNLDGTITISPTTGNVVVSVTAGNIATALGYIPLAGSGTPTQVAFFNASGSVISSPFLDWDNSFKILTAPHIVVGDITPSSALTGNLLNATGDITVAWQGQQLYSANGLVNETSINWLTRKLIKTGGTATFDYQNIAFPTFTSNGFVKTTGGTGTLSIDTSTYITGNQTITLSGEASGSGATAITVALSNAAVIAKVLTGYVSGAGTVSATDSILSAIQKLNGNITALTTGVSSVFGRTGTVLATSGDYTTAQVTESGNLYFTNARAIASVLTGYVSGAGTISASDSVLSAIQKLNGNIGALVTGVSSVSGTTNRITASPTTGAVAVDISASYVGQSSITTVGTLTNLTVTNAPTFSAMTSGSVLFAGTAGLLSQDNSNLFWDNTNKQLRIGTGSYALDGSNVNPLLIKGTTNSYLASVVHNLSNGISASSDMTVGNDIDDGTAATGHYLDAGINSSLYADPLYTLLGANETYLNSTGGDLSIFTYTAGKIIKFATGGSLVANERMRLTDTGLGIGTTTVTSKLNVNATNLGTTQTLISGITVGTNTAAALNAQQISAAVRWQSFGFATGSSTSRDVSFVAFVIPSQGNANPTANWVLQSSTNGGALSGNLLTVTQAGVISTGSSFSVGGSGSLNSTGNVAIANTVNGVTADIGSGSTASGSTAAITIGSGGVSGSIKTITIGSSTAGVTSTITLNGHVTIEAVTSTGATGTGNIVFSAAPSLSGAVLFTGSANLQTGVNLAASNTSIIGGTLTTTQTANYSTGITATGQTKTIHIADAGAAGSTTILTIGSASGTSTTTMNGITIFSAQARLKGYTVATLPAGTQGDVAFCTDLLAPAFFAVVVGGGAVVGTVFYNGTNWVAI